MPITAFKRVELKFLLNRGQLNALLPDMEKYMQPDKYCQNGQWYSIFNVYYDTHDNALIRTSLSKPYHKEKLRMRSYTSPVSENDKVFLELKKKTGGIVHKRRAVLTLREATAFLEGKRPAPGGYMNEQVLDELDYFLRCNPVRPAAYIRYDRIAFFGKNDKNFRITFDSNIRTRREKVGLEQGDFGTPLLEKDSFLMEIKITGALPLWLADRLAELKIYKTRFSKYGTEYTHFRAGNPFPVLQKTDTRYANCANI